MNVYSETLNPQDLTPKLSMLCSEITRELIGDVVVGVKVYGKHGQEFYSPLAEPIHKTGHIKMLNIYELMAEKIGKMGQNMTVEMDRSGGIKVGQKTRLGGAFGYAAQDDESVNPATGEVMQLSRSGPAERPQREIGAESFSMANYGPKKKTDDDRREKYLQGSFGLPKPLENVKKMSEKEVEDEAADELKSEIPLVGETVLGGYGLNFGRLPIYAEV